MPKVTNNSSSGVEAHGWRFLPNSTYALDPQGKRTDHIPPSVVYSPQVRRLVDLGLLTVEGLAVQKKAPKPVAPARKDPEDEKSKESDGTGIEVSSTAENPRSKRHKNRGDY